MTEDRGFFFRKRLGSLITEKIVEYHEDPENSRVCLTINVVGKLKAGTPRKLHRLFGTRSITLKTKGTSVRIVIDQVEFPNVG